MSEKKKKFQGAQITPEESVSEKNLNTKILEFKKIYLLILSV